MADLVAAFGSSHSAMLTCQKEDWMHGFIHTDPKLPSYLYFDKQGNKRDWSELAATATPATEAMVTPEKMAARFDEVMAGIDHIRESIAAAKLDVLIIVGDDQAEIFKHTNMPAMAMYYGDKILNMKRTVKPDDNFFTKARMERLEPDEDRYYPVNGTMAKWLIRQLSDHSFDIAALNGLEPGICEGHAFSFMHRKYLAGTDLPIIPLFLNTFEEPNQPTPKRCIELGKTLGKLIAQYPEKLRVGLLASGGLSHFVVDEDLDRGVIDAVRNNDLDYLASIDPKLLQSGSSEIRNWMVVTAAASAMKVDWVSYTPAYRTPALTGTGLCFATWAPR